LAQDQRLKSCASCFLQSARVAIIQCSCLRVGGWALAGMSVNSQVKHGLLTNGQSKQRGPLARVGSTVITTPTTRPLRQSRVMQRSATGTRSGSQSCLPANLQASLSKTMPLRLNTNTSATQCFQPETSSSEFRKPKHCSSQGDCVCGKCPLIIQEITKGHLDANKLRGLLFGKCCGQWIKVDAKLPLGILHKAAQNGLLDFVLMAVIAGVQVDAQSSLGRTALHFACLNKHPSVVMLLLSCGADVNQVSLSGMTALHFSCQSRADVCVFAILSQTKQFVMVDLEDEQRTKPIHLTARHSSGDAVRYLIEQYKDSHGKLATRCSKKVKPQISSGEFRSMGATLRTIVNESAHASSQLNRAIETLLPGCLYEKVCPQIHGKVCPRIPFTVWLDVIIPFLGLS